MAMRGRWLWALAAAGLAVGLLVQAQTAADAVREGIDLCLQAVIPSLFPFFAVSSLLVSLGAADGAGRVLARPFRRLFRCGGAGCAALLLGLIGGYPVGARTAAALVRQGALTPQEGGRLLTFCNNAGPAFILGIAGSGVFQSPRAGVWLYLIHAAAATAVGVIFCFILKLNLKQKIAGFLQVSGPDCNFPAGPGGRPSPSPAAAFIGAVRGGVTAMAGVCGFVIFFLVVLRLVESFLGPLPPLAAGFVELTNGILRLTADRAGFISAAALLGWGGLSVHCQTAAVLSGSGVSLRWYLPAKAAQALLSAALAAAVWRWVL